MEGRPEDAKGYDAMLDMLRSGQTGSRITAATGCSRSTLARTARRLPTAPHIGRARQSSVTPSSSF